MDFAVIGEEGTAKGIRRLVCVTKQAARDAQVCFTLGKVASGVGW